MNSDPVKMLGISVRPYIPNVFTCSGQGTRAELAAVKASLEKLCTKRERFKSWCGAEEGGEEEDGGEEENGEGLSRSGGDKDGSDARRGVVGKPEAKPCEILFEALSSMGCDAVISQTV